MLSRSPLWLKQNKKREKKHSGTHHKASMVKWWNTVSRFPSVEFVWFENVNVILVIYISMYADVVCWQTACTNDISALYASYHAVYAYWVYIQICVRVNKNVCQSYDWDVCLWLRPFSTTLYLRFYLSSFDTHSHTHLHTYIHKNAYGPLKWHGRTAPAECRNVWDHKFDEVVFRWLNIESVRSHNSYSPTDRKQIYACMLVWYHLYVYEWYVRHAGYCEMEIAANSISPMHRYMDYLCKWIGNDFGTQLFGSTDKPVYAHHKVLVRNYVVNELQLGNEQ